MLKICVLLLSLCGLSFGQICGPNGGRAALSCSSQGLGELLTIRVEGPAGAPFFLFLSDGAGPTPLGAVGTACLSVATPAFATLAQGALSANGDFLLQVPLPVDPALLGVVLYLQALTADAQHPSGLGLSGGLRIDFEVAGGFVATQGLSAPRALATTTAMGDGRVLITGGGAGSLTAPVGTSSAEIFDPITRTVISAPAMNSVRALHTATTLSDGRVLVAGGVGSNVTSAATNSVQIFNPSTRTWTTVAPMNRARAAHAAELLADGRVLVVGGTPTFAGGAGSIGPVLNGSLNDGEVYNPQTNTWTNVLNTMASRRFLPSATRLLDGRVLVVSGLNGATTFFGQDLPTWTATVDFYDPAQNRFVAAPGIGSSFSRAGASATRLANGEVVIAGGVVGGFLGVPTATNSIRIFRNGAWAAGPNLPEAVGLPGLATLSDGSVLFVGGITGTLLAPGASAAVARLQNGSLSLVGQLPAARGAAGVVGLNDGNVVIAGGADSAALPSADVQLFTPDL